jgi:hypothetical protein
MRKSSIPFYDCPINYNDPPIYTSGASRKFFPKSLVVIFFRAPDGPLELTHMYINPYMGWAIFQQLPR